MLITVELCLLLSSSFRQLHHCPYGTIGSCCHCSQDLRRNQDSDDSKKATLKKHVVRAINHAAGEAVQQTPRQTSEADAASVANQSDGAASTFSR